VEEIRIRDGEETTLELKGAIDINCARVLKERLLQALEAGMNVLVSPEGVTALHVSAAQLLWAARRDAAGKGLQFRFTGAVPGDVLSALGEAGLDLFSRSKEVL
jgi:anti-anti-sigma regulatory factor